ncbi:WD40 repeat-like protein, partial [Suillus weaverae]
VYDVAFIRGTCLLVTSSDDKSLQVWDLDTGKQVGEPLLGHDAAVRRVAASPDGRWIVSGGGNGSILVWEVATNKRDLKRVPVSFEGHEDDIRGVVCAHDSETFASASWDETVCVWKRETGKIVLGPLKVGSWALSVSYSTDGKKLAAGTARHIIVWNTKTGEELLKIKQRAFRVTFTPDQLQMVSTLRSQVTRVSKISAAVSPELRDHFKDRAMSLLDAGTLDDFTDDDATTIYEFDASTLKTIGTPFKGHTDLVTAFALLFDGAFLVSASDDFTVKLW